jgi:hypothetical protein
MRTHSHRGLWAVYLGLALATIAAGLVLRLVPLGLPFLVTKYGGSVLWASMVYLLFAALLPGRDIWMVAGAAGVFATLVEFSRLFHSPWLDAFRLTPTGMLLLGRVFQRIHFACYWGAIVATALIDWAAFRRAARPVVR